MRRWILALTAAYLLMASMVAAQVVNPNILEFAPSAEHDVVTSSGVAVLDRYVVGWYLLGATAPVQTYDLGKPTPVEGVISIPITDLVRPMGIGEYFATVTSVGPAGSEVSAPSNPFCPDACSERPDEPGDPVITLLDVWSNPAWLRVTVSLDREVQQVEWWVNGELIEIEGWDSGGRYEHRYRVQGVSSVTLEVRAVDYEGRTGQAVVRWAR